MITFESLQKSFGQQNVLQGIDLEMKDPGIYAILGPNGSGKTTLIKCLMGLARADSGRIIFQGQELRGDEYRRQIAYLPQIARFPENLVMREFLDLIETLRGPAPRRQFIEAYLGLEEYRNQTLRHLSGGTRQKINLTAALMYDPPVLLLDEPTIGLDPVALLALKDFIREEREKGKIILITTHVLDLVEELADQIVFLLEGKVYYRGDQPTLLENTSERDIEHAIAQLLQA